jgi:hypothetical protein
MPLRKIASDDEETEGHMPFKRAVEDDDETEGHARRI